VPPALARYHHRPPAQTTLQGACTTTTTPSTFFFTLHHHHTMHLLFHPRTKCETTLIFIFLLKNNFSILKIYGGKKNHGVQEETVPIQSELATMHSCIC